MYVWYIYIHTHIHEFRVERERERERLGNKKRAGGKAKIVERKEGRAVGRNVIRKKEG